MKKFTLLLVFYLTTFLALAQTSLTAGDIAFLGVNTDGVEDADDSFAFVLLKDVDINTSIIFTDRGWNDGTGFVEPLAVGDGEFTWTSGSALTAGEVVILNFSNLSPNAAAFTVLGDQLFAIQGAISNPIFIAGMQLNIGTGSDDANWDGAATSNTTSALPDALTTGDTAIRFPIEQDNWQFSCSTGLCPLSGTAEEIRSILHNPVNWVSDNTNVFPGTVDVNLGTITVGPVNTPPTITSSSTANVEENQTLAIHVEASDDIDVEGPGLTYSLTGDGVDQLLFNIDEVTGEVTFMNAPDFENAEDEGGNNIYEFQVTVTDSGGLAAMQDISITVTNVDDTPPTISSLTPLNGATDVAVDANLVVEFNEDVQAVSGNNIIILANLVPVVTIPIDDSQVTIGGSTLTINPTADLPSNASISVGIPEGGLEDLAGNDFGGIDPTTGWVFTTAVPVDNTPPVITCPADVFIAFGSPTDPANTGSPDATDANGIDAISFADVVEEVNGFSSIWNAPISQRITRTWTAFDNTGNSTSCVQTISIEVAPDNAPPVAVCQDVMVQLDPNGNATVSVTDIDNGSSDNEGSITYGVQRRVARVFDQNATPDAIFGSGNANGSFTVNQTGSVELGLRAKVRYPTPMNTFNSNGDGTYQHLAMAGSPASRAGWNFEWSVNTDPTSTAGDKLSGLTYEMGIDFDASTGTDYYVFDPINQPFADHAIGTNMTTNGGGVEATDPASYAGLLAANNVAQNSWNLDFFNELAGKTFDPTVDGTYEVYLKAFDGSGARVGETKITVIVGKGGTPGLLPQSIDFTNADIGTNIVELIVVDTAGNTAICTSTVTVKSACEVVIEAQPMDFVVCEKEPYSFRVEATGNGMLSYQWEYLFAVGASWDYYPNATENVLDIPAQGAVINADGWLFRVRVTSDNGTPNDPSDDCTTTSEAATLTVNPAPIVEITGDDSYCHGGNGVVLDAGVGYSSYLWSPGGETTQTISVTEGSYTVEVTNEFGCKNLSEPFMVTNNQPLVCNILQDVLTTDHETTDGVATVNVTGGTDQFTYLWDNGETTQTATTLTYGMHSVTVTDSNGCETNCQIDIAKELYCWTNLVQNVSVRGGNDGMARVYGHGGYRPFTFLWDDGSTKELNTGLTVGTHYVTITDATGATSQCSVTITEPSTGNCNDFTTSIEQEKLTTDHETTDGIATVYPKGGTGQYTYLWDNGETTQTATTITYGMHSVTVTDAEGCISIAQIDIAKELYCWINLYGNVSIHGAKDGSAMVHGNGGYRPHTFKWDDGSTEQLNNNLSAGTHYVTITDATGATSRCSITINQPNEEVCDGVDNDGDGDIDEGFDQDDDGISDCQDDCDDRIDSDGDGISDCEDTCDDTIDTDGDGISDCEDTCDDTIDTDGDGISDCEDTCDDTIDSDGDGISDCQDTCDDTIDTDGDGISDCEDTCDDTIDTDGDGISDCEDTCDDTIDSDGDGISDCQDTCDDTIDTDGDGISNCEDTCDDTIDTDGDGISDCKDTCDDTIDSDGDGISDCEDTCDDTIDTDGDGISDCQDTCDDTIDTDGDGISDCEDDCDDTIDTDGDGVSDCEDICPGSDDNVDTDGDGIPDGCDVEECDGVDNDGDGDIDEGLNCNTGTIDQCETAFARSADENVRTCFLDISSFDANRWGWTNSIPSINGNYELDLYAAAGQCDITKGALVGNVVVVYKNGFVDVTVSVLNGYKVTEAQLYVGSNPIPLSNNGRQTVAPGQYPYKDDVNGDFNTYTFENLSAGDMDNFYVILHANVCPNVTVPKKAATTNVDLTAYPVPFKNEINLKIESPRKMTGKLSIYDAIGQKVQDFGRYDLKEGENEIKLYVNELPVGMYFIHMSSDYGKDILKILGK
ncbi:putative secreted protein (Por secretion system target) [Maribacter caenipelagi]|uniref:Putative secreted protein (Por secretion system target) n=1 Tax=Maribacter caenipelagi TaxID=1447781 RepID=A0A4R7D2R4_9FLAO|nr:Ig-like domain-containing protein [Maribacter caenipelagi]TDS14361.1 putative secreted protein (Por secretion system target) [Maribacter caenipelagi]